MADPRSGSLAARALAILGLLAGAAGHQLVAQQTPVRAASLTRPAALAVPRETPPRDPWERRTRPVALALNSLQSHREGQAPAPSSPFVIDLFDGASVTAVFDRFDPNDSGVTWVGHIPAVPGSRVTLVHGSGLLAASITLPDASYTIRPVPRDPADPGVSAEPIHILSEINDAGYLPEAAPIVPEISTQALAAAELAPTADTAEFIDVLIVYTALAEAWAGSQGGIVNWINLGMSETNSAYAASGVNQRVRLVHTEKVSYTEVGNFSTNLNTLRAGGLGLEGVAALRNAYTADLVSLFIRPAAPTACGIAFIMTSVTTAFAPSGYSVVDAQCSSPNGTLAHEFGHNMGLRHDWYMDAGVTPFTYAHGYVNPIARFRTVMAYPNACTALGIVCTRLLAFSNPDMTLLGQPMGVAGGTSVACPTTNASNMGCDADERRALNNTALAVANFREFSTLRPPSIQTQPQNQSVAPGQALTLRVSADGVGPLAYQWYRGQTGNLTQPIAGATGPTYTFVPGADGVWLERWAYWVRVSNDIGPANSNTATITIALPGADLTSPPRRTLVRGRTIGGLASPRTRLATPAGGVTSSGWWLLDLGEAEGTCRLAEIEAELAWAALEEQALYGLDLSATLERLTRALIVLQGRDCR